MTKVQLWFVLQKPLDEKMMARIADAHTIYGIQHIKVNPSLDELTVEYDATRLNPAGVEAALAAAGIPAVLKTS